MRYGVPYKGSKNKIAEWVVSMLPGRKHFYDLFAGGCAVTHAAMLSGKFGTFTMNDIDGGGPSLFLDAVRGKFRDEKRWISRGDFQRLKDTDPYVRLCWSFGNNGRDYLYSREVEPWKKACHAAVVHHDYGDLEGRYGFDCSLLESGEYKSGSTYERLQGWKRILASDSRCEYMGHGRYKFAGSPARTNDESLQSLERLERLQSLERLERLQSLERLERLERLQSLRGSYDDVSILPDSVIYCDIPYRGADPYGKDNGGFDHDKFYEWCGRQTEPVFISEYWMPEDRFECVAEIVKTVTLCSGAGKHAVERLYVPRSQVRLQKSLRRESRMQLEFDFGQEK